MTKSALNGTTWYWRTGGIQAPILSDYRGTRTRELCLPITDKVPLDAIRTELENNQIDVHCKIVHTPFENFPAGTKVLYAYQPDIKIDEDDNYRQNLTDLSQYIRSNGGTIFGDKSFKMDGKDHSKIDFRSFLKFFGRG